MKEQNTVADLSPPRTSSEDTDIVEVKSHTPEIPGKITTEVEKELNSCLVWLILHAYV